MKNLLLLLLFCVCYRLAAAQKHPDTSKYIRVSNASTYNSKTDASHYLRFDGQRFFDIRKATPEQLQVLRAREKTEVLSNDRFWGLYVDPIKFPRHSLALRFEQNTGAKIYEGNKWRWGTLFKRTILIDGKSDVEVIDGLITPETAKDYRYRIIQNDRKELVGWTVPSVFKRTKNGNATYCFLANISSQTNQVILIEIYNTKNYRDRDAIVIDWRPTRKLEFWATVGYRRNGNKSQIITAGLSKSWRKFHQFVQTESPSAIQFRLGDSLVKMQFISQHEPTPYVYQIDFKRTIDGKEENIDLGGANGHYDLDKVYWNKPGSYEIKFTPKLSSIGGRVITLQKEKAVTYKFTVLPALNGEKLFSSKELALILLVVCAVMGAMVGVLVAYVRKKNDAKLAKSHQEKEISKNQLNNIRAQLNPHFMFNSLAGIQNLMNQHKVDEANAYLNKFARLTRNVLKQKEFVSLADEKLLLDDYLQMEQLRFGFSYEIKINDLLNLDNIEIPCMLLQPFVENAVKHGIANSGSKGRIEVSFAKKNHDLVLTVKDNGEGFDPLATFNGLGLALTKNRIVLLNKIYPITPLALDMISNENGTLVSITLTQWL